MDSILRFEEAMEQDPTINAWLEQQPAELGATARAWFARFRDRGDDVRELMHDGCPVACVEDVPFGYVNVMIGGPIRDDSRSPGASIYGNITEDQGYAQTFATPAENRVAVLAALGIYPFSSQSFAVADVRAADDELGAATWIRDVLWGLSL